MTVACYTRVSTAKQNLDRQLTSTKEYAEDSLGASLADIEVYCDRSSGTNTGRAAVVQKDRGRFVGAPNATAW